MISIAAEMAPTVRVALVLAVLSSACARTADRAVPKPASPTATRPTVLSGLGEIELFVDRSLGILCKNARPYAAEHAVYEKACTTNDAVSCRRLGVLHLCGAGVDENARAAAPLIDKACTLGNADACQLYGALLIDGTRIPRDVARAIAIYDGGCARGWISACATLGSLYIADNDDATDARAAVLLDKACAGDDANACANLSVIHAKGLGGHPTDMARARKLAQGACDRDSMLGCDLYASILVNEGDDVRAGIALFDRTCKKDYARSCRNLAKLIDGSNAQISDPDTVPALLKHACDLGDGEACRLLADRKSAPSKPSDAAKAF